MKTKIAITLLGLYYLLRCELYLEGKMIPTTYPPTQITLGELLLIHGFGVLCVFGMIFCAWKPEPEGKVRWLVLLSSFVIIAVRADHLIYYFREMALYDFGVFRSELQDTKFLAALASLLAWVDTSLEILVIWLNGRNGIRIVRREMSPPPAATS